MSPATATRRRRRKPTAAKIGKEAWQVIDPEGQVLAMRDGKTHTDGAVLNLAQGIAERKYDDEVELVVQLVPLFGDPDPHFRVVRDADGVVHTARI